jgi:hypothetical protein
MPDFRSKLTKQKLNIIVQYALFRWENAVLVAGAILLSWLLPRPFAGWPGWGWYAAAALGVAIIFFSSLTNAQDNLQLLLNEFQGQFDLKRIQLAGLRHDVETALEYQRRIETNVRRKNAGMLWDRPENTADQLDDWIENIYQLALRVDAYRRDALLKQEQAAVPRDIAQLKVRQKQESNPAFQQELARAIESKQKQQDAMLALEVRIKQAELQLSQSLAALATIDSQVQLIEVQDADSGRSERIQADIKEQVDRLNDLTSSINEVYDYHTPGMG